MRRKSIWIGILGVLAIAAAVTLPSFGGGGQNINIEHNPPQGSGCICSHNYDPVECKDGQGNTGYFSNSCVAGCHGFTHCAPLNCQTLGC